MTKYTIIHDKPFNRYKGKNAELKDAIDNMNHGDCILLSKPEAITAISHMQKTKHKTNAGYCLRQRKADDGSGIYVWKLKKEN
tara:strand:- start:1741 stop:1989 length:249 start_codon:yes stop_codon:yes gene_type:complete